MTLPTLPTASRRLNGAGFLVEPFDLFLYGEEQALFNLQGRFAAFLRGLDGPARFAAWHLPASLRPLIAWTLEQAQTADDPWRAGALMAYRGWYEALERASDFQQALCGAAFWSEEPAAARALGAALAAAAGTRAAEAAWPQPVQGDYALHPGPPWHLAPVGRPAGRPLVCALGSYDFRSVEWSFFRPLASLFALNIPLAFVVDVPRTWPGHEAVARLEGVMTALQAHLATSRGVDSAGGRQAADCAAALAELHAGQALHDVQLKLLLAADDLPSLRERVEEVRRRLRPYLGLRVEVGAAQVRAAGYFSGLPTARLEPRPSTWPLTSPALALLLGFFGLRKLAPRRGVVRGAAAGGGWPYIYDDWDTAQGKKAVHECWVGTTGSGKTFALNCYLSRALAHYGVAFDLLEPMGHGALLGAAFNIQAHSLSARRTSLNPHDPVYPRVGEQVAHVIRLYETFLKRPLSGSPEANLQGALLSQALYRHYHGHDLERMTPDQAPLMRDVVDTLSRLGETARTRDVARQFAEEVGGLATGAGPFGHFLDGVTTVDFSIAHEHRPRIFSFHEMEEDAVLVAIAYTQVLAALMRTALRDDTPRIIAVDEVYRMMRHPALLGFLISAVKTLRTRRKKVIVVDQQMRVFLHEPQARLLFENCPIRVIFAQRGGEDIFAHDPAFSHYTAQHRRIIAELPRFRFMMETDEGLFYLDSAPAPHELRLFGSS